MGRNAASSFQVDRFNLAIDLMDRVPNLQELGGHAKEWLRQQIIESIAYAYSEGIEKPEITNWRWLPDAGQ